MKQDQKKDLGGEELCRLTGIKPETFEEYLRYSQMQIERKKQEVDVEIS